MYTVAANNIEPFYPKDFQTGILVRNAGFGFLFGTEVPGAVYAHYGEKQNIIGESKNMVTYENVFSEGSRLDFYPSFLGTSMEMEFDKLPESNEFRFWVEAKNCNVSLEDGGYLLFTSDRIVPCLLYTSRCV